MAAQNGSEGDFKAHQQTYAGVMTLMKWGTAISVTLGLIVVLLIAS